MSESFTRDQLKIAVGKILQTLGWNSINSTPLEILTDILKAYMVQLTRATSSYANEFGCTQANLDHLGLTFRDMNVNVMELEEYVKYVNFGPPPTAVPKYPIAKEDHLNFLKPGSKEVVTRPVHIHEHLPPMNPLLEGTENDVENTGCVLEEQNEANVENGQMFKKPADILPTELKKTSFRKEEESSSRPTREISSVMMTTSGFLSPAREGKLPESRTPISSIEPINPPPSVVEPVEPPKKIPKIVKKAENKKAKVQGPVTDAPMATEEKKKKMASMKWVLKSKQSKVLNAKMQNINGPTQSNQAKALPPSKPTSQSAKINKTLAAARLRTEKLNTTITPITVKPASPQIAPQEPDNVDKLFTEPDKKKVNIFKKISNVKNEKSEVRMRKEDIKQESRESSPDLIIDEPEEIVSKLSLLSNDVTIEPINHPPVLPPPSPGKCINTSYFDDDSQPGTPSTPKTPEMVTHSPPLVKEKRKRKDGNKKIKKLSKLLSPHQLDGDIIDLEMERPKTPEAQGLPKMDVSLSPSISQMPHPFPFFGKGPGLIPTPLSNSLFPPLAFPPMNLPHFGQRPPYLPANHLLNPNLPKSNSPVSITPNISNNVQPQTIPKLEEPNNKVSEKGTSNAPEFSESVPVKWDKKTSKEHKKEKKDKKRNKKDKIKNKAEKKKLKEEKKDRIKKEKKEKRKEKEPKDPDSSLNVKITLKLKSPSPRPETPETRKLNIKPIVKKDEEVSNPPEERKREASPGLAKISALVCGPPKPKTVQSVPPPTAEDSIQEEIPFTPAPRTGPGPGRPRIHPLKSKSLKPKKRRTPIKKDADGNEVWICPACGRQDDGSPMIGCDGCDAWYHWVCVGIQVPPDDNEDWYCRHCLSKKNEDLQCDKQKKKRKKREKKEH